MWPARQRLVALGPPARPLNSPLVAGLLLTGGASQRMGFDKALLEVGGVANAARLGSLLGQVLGGPLVEVGPGRSGLSSVSEQPTGGGPLVALVAGVAALRQSHGWDGPVLVVACDLPLVSGAALSALARWPGETSVVPLWEGRRQPLCARWSAPDLATAQKLVDEGRRSMRALLDAVTFTEVGPQQWGSAVSADELADVDTPEDLSRLGLRGPASPVTGPS